MTSTRSTGRPNSHWASITSSPLLTSVAESMVIFFPMDQVGWRRASSGVMAANAFWGSVRNGPPEAVRTIRRTEPVSPLSRHWKMAECSLSTGRIRVPRARASAVTKAPAITRVSLLASASVFPARSAAMVGTRPAPPTMAETTMSAPVSAAAWQHPLAPPTHLGRQGVQASGQLPRSRFVGQRDKPRAEPADLLLQQLHVVAGGQRHDLELVGVARHHIQRVRPDGSRRTQNRQSLHVPSNVAGGQAAPPARLRVHGNPASQEKTTKNAGRSEDSGWNHSIGNGAGLRKEFPSANDNHSKTILVTRPNTGRRSRRCF